jgi:hypothetical protein
MPRPSWVTALAVGQWYEIPNTNIAAVDPSPVPDGTEGPAAKVQDWCSFCIDTRNSKVYSVANGGHAAYAGNEVDVLTLETETPFWTQVLAPTPNAQVQNAQYYLDGRPGSRHTYYGHVCVEQDDRIMLVGGAWWQSGGQDVTVDSYNISGNSYNAAATHPAVPEPNKSWANGASGGYLATMAVRPSTGDIYFVSFAGGSGGNVCLWTRATNTWNASLGSTGDNPPIGYYTPSAWDSKRERWLVMGDAGTNDDRHVYDRAANTWTRITLSGAEAATVRADQAAIIYCSGLDKYIFRGRTTAGGAVYQIDPDTYAATAFSTTGGASVPGSGDPAIGIFNKFLYVPRLGGAIYYPAYGANAWFLKLLEITDPLPYYRMAGMSTFQRPGRR